jgi:hypothetical protein
MGARLFFEFATETGAISDDEARMSMDCVWGGLMAASHDQVSLQRFERPEVKFIGLLKSAIGSGAAYLADPAGDQPSKTVIDKGHPDGMVVKCGSEFGWRVVMNEWRPQGSCVGWVDLDAGEVYLDPTASLKAAQGMAQASEGIAETCTVLSKRMKEAGLLLRTDLKRETLTFRKKLQGARRDVLHLSIKTLQPDELELDEEDERDERDEHQQN